MEEVICSSCKNSIPSDSEFCYYCGHNLKPLSETDTSSKKCSNCQTIIEDTYEFCPNCGSKQVNNLIAEEISIQQESTKPFEQLLSSSNEKLRYSSGIKETLIWSAILSIITLLFFMFKGMSNVDVVAQILIQGLFARPLFVLFIAFIISIFFKSEKKIRIFNSTCTFIMGSLTIAELVKWFL